MEVLNNFNSLFLSVWEKGILGIDFFQILVGLGIFLLFLVFRGLISRLIIKKLEIISKRTTNKLDDTFVKSMLGPARFLPIVLGVFFASYYMSFTDETREFVDNINRTLITILIFWIIHQIIEPISYILSGLDKILVLVEKRFRMGDWIRVDGIIEGVVERIGFRSTVIRKFDKSLAIIPNFQFAENAVINVSKTTNWLISWIITLQYDTTVDQLKTIRNQIEDHINNSEDFDQSIGVAVRVDKFADSSIDMYVRCFSKTDSWNEWLKVKENLAL